MCAESRYDAAMLTALSIRDVVLIEALDEEERRTLHELLRKLDRSMG